MIWNVYHSKLQSLLNYGMFLGEADNESIPILQQWNRVNQIMCGVDIGRSCRWLVKDYKIFTITPLEVLEVICFIKKYKFSLEQNVHVHYNSKGKKWIYMFCHIIQISKKNLINMGIWLYNKLSVNTKKLD
jgi:hypothetical protein